MGKCHVLLLIIDAARADRFSCYGYERETTPNVDAFAREGTVFLRNYTAGNQTLSSHIALFTGIHPYFTGCGGNHAVYDGRYRTIAEILQRHGYRTVGISNNAILCKQRGATRGFKEYRKLWVDEGSKGKSAWKSEVYKYLRAFIKGENPVARGLKEICFFVHGLIQQERCLRDDKGGRKIVSIIKNEFDAAKKEGKPLFVFANISDVHGPFLPPAGFRNLYFSGRVPFSVAKYWYTPHDFWMNLHSLSERNRYILNALYDGGVAYVDYLLGDLFAYLREEGYLDDTLVIVTSDHGEILGEHQIIAHGTSTYEELVRVPLIIRYPRRFECNRTDDKLTQLVDIFPTILNTVGIGHEMYGFRYQGKDLGHESFRSVENRFLVVDGPYITNPERLRKYPGLLEKYNHVERSVITDEYKYTWSTSGSHRLYRIREDPKEEHNLYSDKCASVIDELHTKLINWYKMQLKDGERFDPYEYNFKEVWWDRWLEAGAEDIKGENGALERKLRELGYLD